MPHSVTCGACKATFSIPDEVWDKRVHGQVATLKCRHCKSPIEVDGRVVRRGSAVNIATSADAVPAVVHPEPKPAVDSPKSPVAEGPRRLEPAPEPIKSIEPARLDEGWGEPKSLPPLVAATTSPQGEKPKGETTDLGRFEVKQPGPSLTRPGSEQGVNKSRVAPLAAATGTSPAGANLGVRKVAERSPTRPALPSNVTHRAVHEATPKPKPQAVQQAEAKSSPSVTDIDKQRDSSELWVVSFGADDDRELTTTQLQDTITKGQVTRETIVWREGMQDWLPIGKIPELVRSFKPEPAAQLLLAHKPAGATDDNDDETMIYRPGSKVAAAAAAAVSAAVAAKATVPTVNAAPGAGKSALATASRMEAAAPRLKPNESASEPRSGSPLFRQPARSAPTLTGSAERLHVVEELSPKPQTAQRATTAVEPQGTKTGGGPPPLRRTQPSRPEEAAATPWSTERRSSVTDEVVTSVPHFEPTRAAAAPPPLPVKEKIETPVAKQAIFPPAVQTTQAFAPVTDVAPHSLQATPSFAPRPSDIAALTKIRPKFPKWLPFAVLGGLVAIVAIFAAMSWFAGDNSEGVDRKASPDVSGPLPETLSSNRPGTSVANTGGAQKDDKSSSGDLSAGFANKFAQAAAKQRPTARFDREAAEKALAPGFAKAAGCHNKGEPTGTANVTISISPSGQVLSVTVAPPFSTSFTAECIRNALREISVPPFQGGSPGRLAHSITIH